MPCSSAQRSNEWGLAQTCGTEEPLRAAWRFWRLRRSCCRWRVRARRAANFFCFLAHSFSAFSMSLPGYTAQACHAWHSPLTLGFSKAMLKTASQNNAQDSVTKQTLRVSPPHVSTTSCYTCGCANCQACGVQLGMGCSPIQW